MIRLELSESEWLTSKRYWNDLIQQLSKPADTNKADFIRRTIFESPNITSPLKSNDITTQIPSVNEMSELMNEIENETKDEARFGLLDEKVKKFIAKPVKYSLQKCNYTYNYFVSLGSSFLGLIVYSLRN